MVSWISTLLIACTFCCLGDIALRLSQYVKNDLEDNSSSFVEEPQSHITVCDINQAMLDVGRAKAEGLGYTSG